MFESVVFRVEVQSRVRKIKVRVSRKKARGSKVHRRLSGIQSSVSKVMVSGFQDRGQ